MHLVEDLRRRLYQGKQASRVAELANRLQAQLVAHGVGPTRVVALEVRGRTTGRTISFPVVLAEYAGEHYLVSMLGQDVSWVRNLRAAGGRAVIRHRDRTEVRLVEVPPAQRPQILRRYLQLAPGARPHIPVDPAASLSEFDRIADDYPVFRVTSPGTAAGDSTQPPLR